MQTLHHNSILFRHAVAKGFRSIGGGNSGRVEQILATPRNAMQWSPVLPCRNFFVGLLRLLQRQLTGQCDNAVQLGIKLLEALEINVGEPLGGEFAALDPPRKLCYRGEGDVFIAGRKGAGIEFAAHEAVTSWPCLLPGKYWIPASSWRQR